MKSVRRSRTAAGGGIGASLLHGVWRRAVTSIRSRGGSKASRAVAILLLIGVCFVAASLFVRNDRTSTKSATDVHDVGVTTNPATNPVKSVRNTGVMVVETLPPMKHGTKEESTTIKKKEETSLNTSTPTFTPHSSISTYPIPSIQHRIIAGGTGDEPSPTWIASARYSGVKTDDGLVEDSEQEAYSTTCHVPLNLPINPRTGSPPFNIALTPTSLPHRYLLRILTTVDTFCIADHEGVPMLANANTTALSSPHDVHPRGYSSPCGQGGDHLEEGQKDEAGTRRRPVENDDDEEIPTTTTYISKHERWAQELAKARRPASDIGAGGDTVSPKERYGIPVEIRNQALVTSSSAHPEHSNSSTHIYFGAARWASARHETIAYSQVVIGYVSVTSTHSGGRKRNRKENKKKRRDTFSSQWHPLGILPATMTPTNMHRLASFIMINFRHDVFAPRAGIEDVIVVTAWGRFFVLGNVGFSLGHSQPFLGEITSRALHSVKATENNTDVQNKYSSSSRNSSVSGAGVLSYENEWLPMVDDPLSFGIRTGEVARNNPFHAEKNWNAFPCYWNKTRSDRSSDPANVGGDTAAPPSFIYGDHTLLQNKKMQSTILCLQRNVAPVVETFAYDLRRRRVVQRWVTPKPHGLGQSARGGKGVLPVAIAIPSPKINSSQTMSSFVVGGGVPAVGGIVAAANVYLLTLVHNIRAHYELAWLLQRYDSPFDVISASNNNGGVSSPFSLYRYHYSLLGKPSHKLEEIDDGEKRQKAQQGRFRRPIEIKPTSRPKLIEFVKSISSLGEDGILFSHTVEDESSIMCVASLGAVMTDAPLKQ